MNSKLLVSIEGMKVFVPYIHTALNLFSIAVSILELLCSQLFVSCSSLCSADIFSSMVEHYSKVRTELLKLHIQYEWSKQLCETTFLFFSLSSLSSSLSSSPR